ncbi:MAG TPA: hypothetical protein VJT73_00195, partial [Polyangiaceae bacterium]|nr:hypothetical protein [Polyangiaceae bacterium]
GKVHVSAGAGVDLLLDGEPVGQAPLAEPLDVAPGTHTIEGRHAGRTATTTVSVQMGKSVTATIALETNPPAVAFPVPVAPMPSASPVAPPPGPETPPDVASRDVAPLPGEELQVSTAGRENFFSWLGHNGVGLAGVGVAAIGLGVFAGFGLAANKASDNSESVSDEIRAEGSRRNISRSNLCANPVEMGFETACRVLRDNRDVRDSDKMVATVGLVAAGVGVAATVTAYLVTSKNSGAAKVNPPSRAVVAPLFGVHESGLAVVGAF